MRLAARGLTWRGGRCVCRARRLASGTENRQQAAFFPREHLVVQVGFGRRVGARGVRAFSTNPPNAPAPVDLAFASFPSSSPTAPAPGGGAGEEGATPVVFIHGLLGSSINFRTMCRKPAISGSRDAFSVDLRNHGDSPHHPDVSSEAMAADIAHFLRARGIPRAHVVGHSLGGRVAMATALLYPDCVERLVVVDIAPVDYRAANAAAVSESSLGVLQAMQRLDLAALSHAGAGRAELDAALAKQPGMEDAFLRGFVLQNCVQDSSSGGGSNGAAPWRWRVGLEELLAGYRPSLMAWPFDAARHSIPHETLFLGGAESAYLRGHEGACKRLCPRGHVQLVAGAGHFVHSEKPAEFAAAVAPFLSGGWTQHVDPATQRVFFFQATTGTSQWELPP